MKHQPSGAEEDGYESLNKRASALYLKERPAVLDTRYKREGEDES
jgi:hypothetical protein